MEMQPPIRFPLAKKVTRPETLVVAVNVAEDLKVSEFGMARVVVVSLIAIAINVITTLPAEIELLTTSTLLIPALYEPPPPP